MLSYHNDPAVKAKYIARFAAHRAADEVIQGTGFDDGRGCFVGCTLDNYDHTRFPVELGWPEWLAHLADTIFEGLPASEAPEFGTQLLAAVPVGVDLEPARHLLAIRRLTRVRAVVESLPPADYISAILTAIDAVTRLHEAEAGGNLCAIHEWSAARSAAESARSAAESARSAAWSAARSAAWSARSAAESARSAAESAWSARSAAESARSAAESARSAESAARAAYQQERDDLLEILRNLEAK